jgi:hypothetical protein
VVGVAELVVFDPLLAGPRAQGGPWLLQLWRRASDGGFERVHQGSDAAWCATLGAFVVPDQDARRLRIAANADGSGRWLTGEEQALKRAEDAEAQARAADARGQEAKRRVAELEAELARR